MNGENIRFDSRSPQSVVMRCEFQSPEFTSTRFCSSDDVVCCCCRVASGCRSIIIRCAARNAGEKEMIDRSTREILLERFLLIYSFVRREASLSRSLAKPIGAQELTKAFSIVLFLFVTSEWKKKQTKTKERSYTYHRHAREG